MPRLPEELLSKVRSVGCHANQTAAEETASAGLPHEPEIDFVLMSEFIRHSGSFVFDEDWSVSIEAHRLDNFPFVGGREVGDFGVWVQFEHGGRVEGHKIVLLQSKRLMPREDRRTADLGSQRRLFPTSKQRRERVFVFDEDCRYEAIRAGDQQVQVIDHFQENYDVLVYYLLYNPSSLPLRVVTPQRNTPCNDASFREDEVTVEECGCRIVPASSLHKVLNGLEPGKSPSYSDIADITPDPKHNVEFSAGWRFEDFLADLLLPCKEAKALSTFPHRKLIQAFRERKIPRCGLLQLGIEIPGGLEWLPEERAD